MSAAVSKTKALKLSSYNTLANSFCPLFIATPAFLKDIPLPCSFLLSSMILSSIVSLGVSIIDDSPSTVKLPLTIKSFLISTLSLNTIGSSNSYAPSILTPFLANTILS